jgi:hypothetical protein
MAYAIWRAGFRAQRQVDALEAVWNPLLMERHTARLFGS